MEKKGNIDETKKVIITYVRNPQLLANAIDEHNKMLHELNKKVIKIFNVSPIIGVGTLDVNGKIKLLETKLDAPSHELLNQIKEDNEKLLRASFHDLYIYTDHLNENNGEINDSIFN